MPTITHVQAMGNDQPGSPLVAFVSYFDYAGSQSLQLSFAPYKEALVSDAGGRTLNFSDVASIKGVKPNAFSPTGILDFSWGGNGTFATRKDATAALQKVLQNVDVVVDETYAPDPMYNMTTFLVRQSCSPCPQIITCICMHLVTNVPSVQPGLHRPAHRPLVHLPPRLPHRWHRRPQRWL